MNTARQEDAWPDGGTARRPTCLGQKATVRGQQRVGQGRSGMPDNTVPGRSFKRV